MSNEQIYRVLFYAGTSLINTAIGCNEAGARIHVDEWIDEELDRTVKVEPPLPTLEAPEVAGSTIPVLSASFSMVTYETDMGEFNIVTDDCVQADIFMAEFMRELGMQSDGIDHVMSVMDGPPVHVVIIEGLTHVKSIHPSDVVKPVKEADETAGTTPMDSDALDVSDT